VIGFERGIDFTTEGLGFRDLVGTNDLIPVPAGMFKS
jgi:hypothetical protein